MESYSNPLILVVAMGWVYRKQSNSVVLAQGLGRLYLVCPSIVPGGTVVMGYVVFLWLGFVNVGAVTQEDKAL